MSEVSDRRVAKTRKQKGPALAGPFQSCSSAERYGVAGAGVAAMAGAVFGTALPARSRATAWSSW